MSSFRAFQGKRLRIYVKNNGSDWRILVEEQLKLLPTWGENYVVKMSGTGVTIIWEINIVTWIKMNAWV